VKGTDRDYVTISSRFEHEGFGFLSVSLPSLFDSILIGIEHGRIGSNTSFRKKAGTCLPKLFLGFTSYVFNEAGLLRDDAAPWAVKCLREICYLFKKVQLSDKQELILDAKAKATFFEVETQVNEDANLRSPVFDHICRYILPNLDDWEVLPCRHGPGAVHEGHTANQKWLAVESAFHLGHAVLEDTGLDVMFNADTTIPEDLLASKYANVLDSAKLVTVPKNSRSRRTITMEPVLRQYVQQGLNEHLRDHILKDSILSCCLTLSDQSRNSNLALSASRTRRWATMDLSSASDRMSLSLVQTVFQHRPRFLAAAVRCRSSMVLSDNITKTISKFAGMGNALTFPIQSVVFAMLAIAAIVTKGSSRLRPSFGEVKRAARCVRVFGDDIIVHTEHFTRVAEWLTSAGLKVNQQKSFSLGNFRESCGIDAFKGVDVTPVYVRSWPSDLRNDPSGFATLVAASNHLWDRCLYRSADVIRNWVEEVFGELPLTAHDSGHLGWHTRKDAYTFQRWNRVLHRFEQRYHLVMGKPRRDAITGYAALWKCLSTRVSLYNEEHLHRTIRRFTLIRRTRWDYAT
jgi:hypothetical protein